MTSCWKVIETKCLKVMFKDKSTSSERALTSQLLLLEMAFFQAKGDVIAFIDCHCAPQDQWHKVRIAAFHDVSCEFSCLETSLWEQILMHTADTPVHLDSLLEISQG